MSETSGDDDGGLLQRLEGLPLVGGFVGGIFSFVGGYVLFLALLMGTGEVAWSNGVGNTLRSVGHVFYNAFNVPTYQQQTFTVESGETTRETVIQVWQNSVTGVQRVVQQQVVNGQITNEQTQTEALETALAAPELVYLAVPVLGIVLAGVLLGYRHLDVETDDPNVIALRSVGGGVAMTAGFLVFSLGLTFVLVRTGQNAILHPARLEAILYGIAYPFLGGTTSLALGQILQARTLDEETSTEIQDDEETSTATRDDGTDDSET